MIRLRRGYRLVALTVIAWAWAAEVLPAQMADHPPKTPPTLALAKAGVPVGGVVYVTDPTGRTIKGKLATLTSDDVQVRIGATVHSFAAAEILRIRWQQPNTEWNRR